MKEDPASRSDISELCKTHKHVKHDGIKRGVADCVKCVNGVMKNR